MFDEEAEESALLELSQDALSPSISQNGVFPDTDELPHLQNKLNDLPGGQWLYFTKSLLTTAYPAQYGHELRRKHGANKPPQLMKTLIEYFTKHDELVLDPFAGVGGTLIGATIARQPRRAVGIEINREWIDIYNLVVKQNKLHTQQLILGDCVAVMKGMAEQTFDFIATDPPYNIHFEQTMSNDRYAQEFANRRTDYNMRSDEERDIANLASYDEYLAAMKVVFEECYRLLKSDKYMVFIVRDAYQNGEYIMTHADLTKTARDCGFKNKGDIIWYQAGTRLRPYGYPYAFVPNIVHQHIVVLHKAKT
ncbi:MAG TPA: DNA methyltransferase [Ktedonobacteraceae bacterium]|nr:DNA methyltransferase [Ktedonobacteraceae bacterium]